MTQRDRYEVVSFTMYTAGKPTGALFYSVLNTATAKPLFMGLKLNQANAEMVCEEMNDAFDCGRRGEPAN